MNLDPRTAAQTQVVLRWGAVRVLLEHPAASPRPREQQLAVLAANLREIARLLRRVREAAR